MIFKRPPPPTRLRDFVSRPSLDLIRDGALVSVVTMLLVLPWVWSLPGEVLEIRRLATAGVRVEARVVGHDVRSSTSYFESKPTHATHHVLDLRYVDPAGAPHSARTEVPAARYEAAVASGRLALVLPPGAPERFYVEGLEWAPTAWKFWLLLLGLAPLLFAAALIAMDLAGHLRHMARSRWDQGRGR